MKEVLPGVWSWATLKGLEKFLPARFQNPTRSYYLDSSGVLIDPNLPLEGFEWFEHHPPRTILIWIPEHGDMKLIKRLVARFKCPVLCHPDKMAKLSRELSVKRYERGTIAQGVELVGANSEFDRALRIGAGAGALLASHGIVRFPASGSILLLSKATQEVFSFLPRRLRAWVATRLNRLYKLRNDADTITTDSLRRFSLEQDFDSLFFVHGDPIVGGAKTTLNRFLEPNRPV